MDGNRKTTVVGFAGALVVLGLLFWVVGIDALVAHLSRARLPIVLGVVAMTFTWLSCWGMSLHTVLGALGSPVSARTAIVVFTSSVFSNAVTPFGQAGGEPIAAFFISEAADSEYETGLAAIASVDTLHFVPSVGFATVGLGTVVVASVNPDRNLILAATAVGLLAVGFLGAVLLGWRYRYEIERLVVRALTPVIRRVGDVLPQVDPPGHHAIENRIEGFFVAIDRIAGDRRALLLASLYSAAGWLSLSTALWLSFAALGHLVPFLAMLVVVPVASIAAITPLPGGLGGVEAAFIALVLSTTGVTASVAAAGVVVYRLSTYWLSMVIGGGTTAILGERYRSA